MITGGASGIGRSLARALAREHQEDHRPGIVIADMDLGAAADTVAELESLGAQALAVGCDISLENDVEDLARATIEHFGGVNLLCNIAGVQTLRKLHETSALDVEWLFSVNVFGLCHMVRHFVPHLQAAAKNQQLAYIINASSGFGLAVPPMGQHSPSVYTGTKHAVVGLSDALRKDLAGDGIGVSVVCPGVVNTNTWNSMSFRQERFGGPIQGTQESKSRVEAYGQDADEVAKMILEGVRRSEFFILPLNESGRESMRREISQRHEELATALDSPAAR